MLETVVQAQDRSRKPLGWVLEHLGLPSATYFRWLARGQKDELEDRIVVPPQTRKPLPEEEQAAKTFALAHTKDGYRRLAWMMVDENVVFLRPSAVYGVLNLMAMVGGAVGPVGAGIFFDAQKTYLPVFYLFIGLILAIAVVAILMKSAPRPIETTGQPEPVGAAG